MRRKTLEEARLAREVERLEDKIASLQYTVDELMGTTKQCPIPSFTGARHRMVSLLAARAPRVVTFDALYQTITDDIEAIDKPKKLLRVQIHMARRRLKDFGIEIQSAWGDGYLMDSKNAAKWQSLVDQANGRCAA